jgi:hypothetical protein
MPLYKADHSGISSPLFQRFLPRSGTWALRRQPVFWTAVLVLWKFFILVAFVTSFAKDEARYLKKKKKKKAQFVAGTLESYLLSLLSVG